MNTNLTLQTLVATIVFAVTTTACSNTVSKKTEKVDGTEWNVAINKVVEFNDTALGISTDQDYTVADTATVNALLKDFKHCGNITIAWTLPSADGSIWLTAYEDEPLLSEIVKITEVNPIPSYGDNIQVAFKFADADKWANITRESIGERLAVIVNGQLMNAPQVNTEISSGNCSVTIPKDMVKQFLPDLDLEKIRQ